MFIITNKATILFLNKRIIMYLFFFLIYTQATDFETFCFDVFFTDEYRELNSGTISYENFS